MTICVHDRGSVASLCAFFERLGYVVVQKGGERVDVDLRERIDERQERLLIALFLARWRAEMQS